MPDGGQWLTVRQFADIAGVSTEAVRQRLHKDLQSYVKTENGRKFVNPDALQFIGKTRALQALDKDFTSTLQDTLQDTSQEVDKLQKALHDAELKAAAAAAELDAEKRRADFAEKRCAELDALHSSMQSRLDAMSEKLISAETARAAAVAALDAERKRADAAALKADSLTERLATIAERQADALRASEARQLVTSKPAEAEQQPRKGSAIVTVDTSTLTPKKRRMPGVQQPKSKAAGGFLRRIFHKSQ